MKKNKIVNKLIGIIPVLIVIAGLAVLMYPTVSNYLNMKNSSRAVANYINVISKQDDEDYQKILSAAHDYNKYLYSMNSSVESLYDENGNPITYDSYWDILDINGNGMMGYITISRINRTLPIYHGTDESVLQTGVGHLQNTSLPVGNESTHAVLSGHRGLPSAKLFTDIDQMVIDDEFYINIMNETLAYKVISIDTVEPTEVDKIAITAGEDYVTLVTCTPYGINSHRLLIKGTRVDYEPEVVEAAIKSAEKSAEIPMHYIYLAGAAVILIIFFIVLAVILNKKRKAGYKCEH